MADADEPVRDNRVWRQQSKTIFRGPSGVAGVVQPVAATAAMSPNDELADAAVPLGSVGYGVLAAPALSGSPHRLGRRAQRSCYRDRLAQRLGGAVAADDPAVTALCLPGESPRDLCATAVPDCVRVERLAVAIVRDFARTLAHFEQARCGYILRAILSGSGSVRRTPDGWSATLPQSPLRVVLDAQRCLARSTLRGRRRVSPWFAMTSDVAVVRSSADLCIERARFLLRRAVSKANERRATAFDPMRGLYVTEAEVADILARDRPSPEATLPGFGFTIPEVVQITSIPAIHDAVALAVAAERLPRLDRVFGFLHDDLTRRSLTVGLLVEMLAADPALFDPEQLLVRLAMVNVVSHDIPLSSSVRIDRGFLAVLAGDSRLDARIRSVATPILPPLHPLLEPVVPESPLVLWGGSADDIAKAAAEVCAAAGRGAIRLSAEANAEHIGIAARDALLRDDLLIL